MHRERALLLAVVSLLVASVAVAQIPMPAHIVPIGSKVKGDAGTDWLTDLAIFNMGKEDGRVGIHYFPANVANTFNGTFGKQITLQAGKGIYVKDVVGSWFPSAGLSTSGWLLVGHDPANCSEGPDPMWLVVTARIYNNADPSKTYGQTVPSSLFHLNLSDMPSVITGVKHQPGQVPGFRTNVGVTNLSRSRIRVTVKAFTDAGIQVGTGPKESEALSVGQWNLSEFGVTSLESGRVEFWMDPANITSDVCEIESPDDLTFCFDPCDPECDGYSFPSTGVFIAYASKVDNGSADAEFLLPVVDWVTFILECGFLLPTTNGVPNHVIRWGER